jgi:hypothetical protein
MTALTPEQRGDLAEKLLPYAARLACLVHGDGDQRDVHQTIARLDRDQRDALLVVLAGLVNPDAKLADVLGYLSWDENGNPLGQQRLNGTVRGLTYLRDWPVAGWLSDDAIRWEQRVAARALAAAGEHYTDISDRLGVSSRTVERWLAVAT